MQKRSHDYTFHAGQMDEANPLVLQYHYSKRLPSNVQFVGTWHDPGGLFGDFGDAIAACYFSIPPTRWKEEVWELSRLVRRDDAQISLTGLISDCCHWIKKKGLIDLLVSFADSTQGHHGGIYQASSWNYAGKREPNCDGLIIDGIFRPGRSCNSIYGTRSLKRLKALRPTMQIEEHFDKGKFLYWKSLKKSGAEKAKAMGLLCLPYPKPATTATQETLL
jgi:hypothetical protein